MNWNKLIGKTVDRFLGKMGYVRRDEMGTLQTEQVKPLISASYGPSVLQAGGWKEYHQLVDAYSSWVYTAVDKIAKSVAMIHIKLYVFRKEKEKFVSKSFASAYKSLPDQKAKAYFLKQHRITREEITDHPFLNLISAPNAIMTRFMLWYETMVRLELGGLCGWYLVKNRLGLPAEIWPLPLTKYATLTPKVTSRLEIEYWEYHDGSVLQRFEPDEILLMKYPHPASPFQGMSALRAQTYPYDIDLFLMQQQKALFEHGANPGLHLTTDQVLSKDLVKELREQINEQYAGALKSGETLITHSGLRAEKLGMTGRDAMIRDVERMARDKIITAYDLSPGKVGLVEDVNRANAEALNYSFIQECLRPRCMLIEETLEAFLLPLYDEGLTCDFELPDYGDKEFRLREREVNLRTYYTTINEERAKEGYEPVPWGDKPWGTLGTTQITASSPAYEEEEEEEKNIFNEGEKEPPKATKKMNRAFWTDERKDIHWKIFVQRSEKYEKYIVKAMRSYFSRLEKEVIERLNQYGKQYIGRYAGWSRQKIAEHLKANPPKEINIDKQKEMRKLVNLITPIVKVIMKEAGDDRIKDISEWVKLTVGFNINDPRTVRWIGARMRRFSREVTNTTFDDIEAILREGFLEGQPITTISQTLHDRFESWDKYRAPLIARTETISAMNKADIEAVYQMGLEERVLKHWLTAQDEAVRETHRIAGERYEDGIPINELFQVGDDEMEAPGGGTIGGENINCRCTLYYTEREEEQSSFDSQEIQTIKQYIQEAEKLLKQIEEEKEQKQKENQTLIEPVIEKLNHLKEELTSINDKMFISMKSAVEVLKEKIESEQKMSELMNELIQTKEVKLEPIPIDLKLQVKDKENKKFKIIRDKDGKMVSVEIESN